MAGIFFFQFQKRVTCFGSHKYLPFFVDASKLLRWKVSEGCKIYCIRILINNWIIKRLVFNWNITTVWKVSVFGVFLVHIFPNSDWIRIRTNTDQKNSEYGHFSRSLHATIKSSKNVVKLDVCENFNNEVLFWGRDVTPLM